MRKYIVIALLLMMQLAVSSCETVSVEVRPAARKAEVVDLKRHFDPDGGVDETEVFLARTINTVHSILHYPSDFNLPDKEGEVVLDGKSDMEDPDAEEPTEEDLAGEPIEVRNAITGGFYHAVAFSSATPELFQTVIFKKGEKWEKVALSAFLDEKMQYGLMDLYATIPGIVAQSDEETVLPPLVDLENMLTEDELLNSLFQDVTATGFRTIPTLGETWIGVSPEVELRSGNREVLELDMTGITQEVTVTLKIRNLSPELVDVDRVAVSLVGVPSCISLLDKTVAIRYEDGQIRDAGAVIFELFREGDKQAGTETVGDETIPVEYSVYKGTVRTMGVFEPEFAEVLNGQGILQVRVQKSNGKRTPAEKRNLLPYLGQSPSLFEVEGAEVYSIKDWKGERGIIRKVNLDLRDKPFTVSERAPEDPVTEEDNWKEDPEDGNINIIPED